MGLEAITDSSQVSFEGIKEEEGKSFLDQAFFNTLAGRVSSKISEIKIENYVNKLRALYARAMAQQMRFSEKEQFTGIELKRGVRGYAIKACDKREYSGKVGVWGSVASIGAQALRFIAPKHGDFINTVSNNLPSIFGIAGTRANAHAVELDSRGSVASSELQAKLNKPSDNASENIKGTLQAGEDLYRAVSSSNG